MELNGKPAGMFSLSHDEWGKLVLTDALGRPHAGAEVIRAFPITDPRHGISVCDSEGREIVWIDDLDAVPEPTRRLLEEELGRRQFLPILQRIIRVSGRVEPTEWEIETDRGPTRFTLKSEEDVRRLANHRGMVIDAHGVRYLIPDLRAMDGHSRRVLERYL